jgi:SPP1 family predicted phage head-tail adaptor
VKKAGEMKHWIAFDKREDLTAGSPQDDGFGNTEGDWQEQFVIAAGLKPLKGGEDVLASRLTGKQPVIIWIRASARTRTITTAWRARDARDGTVYNIRTATDMEGDRMFIDLLCEAGVAV